MAKSVLLLGYSGHKNFGDDLLLYQVYKQLYNDASLTIKTNCSPEASEYLLKWFPRSNIERQSRIQLRNLIAYDYIVFFGGGVFFDYEDYSLARYLKKCLSIIRNFSIPRFFGVKILGIGIGLGPFTSERAVLLNRFLIRHFDFIGVRDIPSLELVKSYNIPIKIYSGYDLSFHVLKDFPELRNNSIPTKKSILVCPRGFRHVDGMDEVNKDIANIMLKLRNEHGYKITVFAFQTNQDEQVLRYYKDLGLSTSIWDPDVMNINDVFELFKSNEQIVSSRMHGVYVGGILNRKCIGINVHPKVSDAANRFNRCIALEPDKIDQSLESLVLDEFSNFHHTDLSEYVESSEFQYEKLKGVIKF